MGFGHRNITSEITKVYAVISDRNRQNGVRVGDVVECDLNTAWTTGDVVKFDNVLFLSKEG